MTARLGVTLIELIVVIALLTVVAGVTGLAFRRPRVPTLVAGSIAIAMAARDSALRTGRAVTIRDTSPGGVRAGELTAYPDGRVLADSALGIDPLSGRAIHAP